MPDRLFPRHLVVAHYGAPTSSALGILGRGTPEQAWQRLARDVRRFSRVHRDVLPTFELIVVVAQSAPGPDGDYAARVPDAEIAAYHRVVRRHRGVLLLDVQPGRSPFLHHVKSLERWLLEPDVMLAIDPEWRMGPGEAPWQSIGSVVAAEVNEVSGWLDRLVAEHELPPKMLLVHQFTTGMVDRKNLVKSRRHVELVFNMDGFGARSAKLSKYRMLAKDRRFPLGFKLFLRQDIDRLAPADAMRLRPRPVVVEYQ